MLENALKYLVGLGKVDVKEVRLPDGTVQAYADRHIERLDRHYPMAEPVRMGTLTSLVDYIRSGTDTMAERMLVQVESPVRVCLAIVDAAVPSFPYDKFTDCEAFCIGVQSKFIDDPGTDKAVLLKVAGTAESGSVAEYGDDGVTQKVTVKQGISLKKDAIVPNPVKLRPYRTFPEVEQPASPFIFRMNGAKGGVGCALFEADGGAWRNLAMEGIKAYLQGELEGLGQFTVIS